MANATKGYSVSCWHMIGPGAHPSLFSAKAAGECLLKQIDVSPQTNVFAFAEQMERMANIKDTRWRRSVDGLLNAVPCGNQRAHTCQLFKWSVGSHDNLHHTADNKRSTHLARHFVQGATETTTQTPHNDLHSRMWKFRSMSVEAQK